MLLAERLVNICRCNYPPPALEWAASSTLELMSEVARKILSKDPAAEAERKKKAEEAKAADGHYHGKSNKTDPKVSNRNFLPDVLLRLCV